MIALNNKVCKPPYAVVFRGTRVGGGWYSIALDIDLKKVDLAMKTTVRWADNAMFVGESGSGHCVVMDGPEEHGGRNVGIRPMEMILIGMGGCASFDVVSILKKSRQQVSGCEAQLSAERAETVPAIFTAINIHFAISGENLKEKQVKRAVELSAEKYCSASIMLANGGVEISHSYEIVGSSEDSA